ncbi:MAG: phosphoheptose isomerase [Gammaproteobacteria bacterium RBG_16_57_12]|nr:MAG: phosphoheptose isomerase [Gammaproteobacteria bacterium RBG_16_57_12]
MSFNLSAALDEHRQALECVAGLEAALGDAVKLIRHALDNKQRVFVCGNGGSAADAQHFAAELTGRFEKDRPGLPAISLTTDTSAITSIGNDFGFDAIFSRQLGALAQPGDVLLAISTSGNSPNVLRAVEYARLHGIRTIGLFGRDGGKMLALVDVALNIPVLRTARIQEMHIFILHMLCEALEA